MLKSLLAAGMMFAVTAAFGGGSVGNAEWNGAYYDGSYQGQGYVVQKKDTFSSTTYYWCCRDCGAGFEITGFDNSSSEDSVYVPCVYTGTWSDYPSSSLYVGYTYLDASVVPSEVNDKKLIRIGARAFTDCAFNSIDIPNTVTTIEQGAFYNCTKLIGLELSEGLTKIGIEAFFGCSSMTRINIPASVADLGEDAFNGCTALASIKFEGAPPVGIEDACIPSAVALTYDASYAAAWKPVIAACGFTNAQPYYVPVTITFNANGGVCDIVSTNIASGAAVGELPTPTRDGYTFLGGYTASEGGEEVTAVTFVTDDLMLYARWDYAVEGPYYEEVDGVSWLYYKKNDSVIVGGGSTEEKAIGPFAQDTVTIPSTLGDLPVTTIAAYAFYGCDIATVVVPESVTAVGDYAFAYLNAGYYWPETSRVCFEGDAPAFSENALDDFYDTIVISPFASGWDLSVEPLTSHSVKYAFDKIFEAAGFTISDMTVGDENYAKLRDNGGLSELSNWTQDAELLSLTCWSDFDYTVSRADDQSTEGFPAGTYRVTYTAHDSSDYAGDATFEFTISKASYTSQGYGPVLYDQNDNYDYMNPGSPVGYYTGTFRTDDHVYLRGYWYYGDGSNCNYPSYSVLYNWSYWYGEGLYSVADNSTLANTGEYRWDFYFLHAGNFEIDVNVPSTYFEDDWCCYTTESWYGSYSVTVNPADINEYVTVTFPEDLLEYNGLPQIVTNTMFSIAVDGSAYTPDEYFQVGMGWSYSELTGISSLVKTTTVGVAAGTYQVPVIGMGDYEGTVMVDVVINPRSITHGTIAVTDGKWIYNGAEQRPGIVVTDSGIGTDGATLTEGVDYTVSYANNILPGNATITVQGISNYTGTASASFTIEPAHFKMGETGASGTSMGFGSYVGEYDGKGHCISVSVLEPAAYDALYALNAQGPYSSTLLLTNVCSVTEWCQLSAVGYASVTGSAAVVITSRSITNATISATNEVLTIGGDPQLKLSVVDCGLARDLEQDVDYTYTVSTDRDLGRTEVLVRGIGNYADEISVTIPYQKSVADLTVTLSENTSFYTGSPICPDVEVVDTVLGNTLVKGVDYRVSYASNTGVGTGWVMVTGIGNYTGKVNEPFEIVYRQATIDGHLWYYVSQSDSVILPLDSEIRTHYNDSLSGVVVVPDEIDGLPVKSIPEGLFEGCTNVTTFVLGTNIVDVGYAVFSGCSVLQNIIFQGEEIEATKDVFDDDSLQPNIFVSKDWTAKELCGRALTTFPEVTINPPMRVTSGRDSVTFSYKRVEGVTELRYTKDGTDPIATSPLFPGVISVTVTGLTTVKVAVFVAGVRIGDIAQAYYAPTLTEIFDANELLTSSASAPITYDTGKYSWEIDDAESVGDGTPCMRSSTILEKEKESYLSASFSGAGVFEFSWKSSCEWDDEAGAEEPIFDHGYCMLDGAKVAWIDGETDWTNVVINVSSEGSHEIRWVYVKNSVDYEYAEYDDCIWVDGVRFTYPVTAAFEANGATGATPETIATAPGYTFVIPAANGLSRQKYSFGGWQYGDTTYAVGDSFVADPTNMIFWALWTEKNLSAPVIDVAVEYDAEATWVTITNAENVTVYYTTDGREPSAESAAYNGSFKVTGDATIKAIALDDDWFDSPVATATTTRSWTTLEDCLGATGFALSTGGDRNWIGDTANACVKSVALADGETSWFKVAFSGAGVVEWMMKSPTNDWTRQVAVFETAGEHELCWEGSEVWIKSLKYTAAAWISFSSAEDTTGELPATICSAAGYAVTLPPSDGFARTNYTFTGWSDGAGAYQPGDSYSVTGDVAFAATWTPNLLEPPVIEVSAYYETETTLVTITNVAEVVIYYTLDGSEPTTDSNLYAGPFEVAGSYTIKAFAVAANHFDSRVATATTTRAPWTVNECLSNTNLVFTMSGNANWSRDLDVKPEGASAAMRSGAIDDSEDSLISAVVSGPGTLSFWCKVSSEGFDKKGNLCDGLTCVAGGKKIELGGDVGWTNIFVKVEGSGEHAISWTPGSVVASNATVVIFNGIAIVTPTSTNVISITITEMTGFDGEIKIPNYIETVKGIAKDKVQVWNGDNNLTRYLDFSGDAASGVTFAVKDDIVKDVFDTERKENPAEIKLDAASPSIQTAPTIPGLKYEFYENTSLENLKSSPAASKVGDGNPWKPAISVSGGKCGFYSIGVKVR